jgi:hypothetical protein
MSVKGSLVGVGNVRSGQAHGSLTLSNRHGTFTLQLTGPAQRGLAALPGQFQYRITGGTGAYRGLTGQGTLNLSAALFAGYSNRGHFDLSLHPKKT